ncbi:hypothetical protein BDZ94DRAFT_1178931, partial [Collybia nuda]
VFEGILPEEHNENLLTLLFHLGHWHGLAKLRLHTETTLAIMDEVTIALGKSLRDFEKKTCSAYDTRELRRKAGARQKRHAKASSRGSGTLLVPLNATSVAETSDAANRTPKTLNLNTYKNHSLGDYTETIRRYGTTDSYSTEIVCYIFMPDERTLTNRRF